VSLDPRTPVLVGAAAVTQREEDPARAREPLELMIAALERAAEDAGSRALLTRADSIRAPSGFWKYADPCRLIADRLGASAARTLVAEIGVLQTTLFGGAAEDIARGRADIVLVTGGEARHRALRAGKLGVEAPETVQGHVTPDAVLRPAGAIFTELEASSGLVMPVSQFAMIENALRAAQGRSIEEHQRAVAALWAGMSEVAAGNPNAWRGEAVSAESIRSAGPGNPMQAFPYAKRHISQWNVDQAAGLVFTSVETARSLGIPRERWVFPLAVADSNHMLPLSERPEPHRSHGFALALEQVLASTDRRLDEIDHLELYSCFPAAVGVQLREFGIAADRPLTVTGGMAAAGGPLNNFVLQALARMAGVLRGAPGSLGMVTAVSGMLTKQGVSLWSTEPGSGPFAFADVSVEAGRATGTVEIASDGRGDATVATYTVLYEGEKPSRAVLLCDLADGRRALVATQDEPLALDMTREEFCGRAVRIGEDHRVEPL
jgi:acetyl-CoA C-acetyltransferase